MEVKLSQLTPSPLNPRKNFADGDFDELVESIRQKGIIQPLVVRKNGKGYEIIAGHRRYEAAKKVDKNMFVPVVVRETPDDEVVEIMIVENLMRADLTELEEAEGFKSYLDRGKDADELAEKTGLSPQFIRRRTAILDLPKKVLKAWDQDKISFGHLEQLMRVSPTEIDHFLERAIDGWRVEDLKRAIESQAPPLNKAKFDKKECSNCPQNSSRQKKLFGDDFATEKVQCLLPECFNKKLLEWAKAQYGDHVLIEVEYSKHHQIYGKAKKECKDCTWTFVDPLNSDKTTPVCVDTACYKKTYYSTVPSSTTASRPGHGAEFRDKFLISRYPAIASELQEEPFLKLVLYNLVVHGARCVRDYVDPEKKITDWITHEMVWEKIQKIRSGEEVCSEIVDIMTKCYEKDDSKSKFVIARTLGVDLVKDWQLNQDYLKKKRKSQLVELGKKLKILTDSEVKAKAAARYGHSKFDDYKKTDLIDVLLTMTDLNGKVPKEILEEGL